MHLAVSYNFFNGEEHFIPSLKSIRRAVETISVVWQEVSNAGEPLSDKARLVLKMACDQGLVDEAICYEPDLSIERRLNELEKRRIGLRSAKKIGATHFLNLDTDEFYRSDELLAARRQILLNGYKSTSVSSFLHVKRPIYRALDTTNLCFITELTDETEIGVSEYPCQNVDSTRKLSASKETHHHFSTTVVAMYHMNLVRYDLKNKLRNSSTTDDTFLEEVEQNVADWQPNTPLIFPKKGELYFDQVENEFNTWDPISGGFYPKASGV